MTFEDTLEIQIQRYCYGIYAVVGNTLYRMTDDGEITSEEVDVNINAVGFDEGMNPIQPSSFYYPFSKCFISFNSSAAKVRLNDGTEYIYSYYVIAPLKAALYHLIPKEGTKVKITKADGTVEKEMEVKGFVTYKKRYLKIWL